MMSTALSQPSFGRRLAGPYLPSLRWLLPRFFSGGRDQTPVSAIAGPGGTAVASGPPGNSGEAWAQLIRSLVFDGVGLGFAGVAMYLLLIGQTGGGFAAAVGLAAAYLGRRTSNI